MKINNGEPMLQNIKYNLKQYLAIALTVPICAMGVTLFTKAGWGTDPFTSFEIGLSYLFNTRLGYASLIFEGSMFFVFLLIRRNYVKFGTVAFCFGIGPCLNVCGSVVDFLLSGNIGLLHKLFCFILGSIFIVFSLAFYTQFHQGYQTLDMLSMLVAELARKTYGFGLSVTYAVLALSAALMGVKMGVGTIIAIVCFGKLVNIVSPLLLPLVKSLQSEAKET